MNEKDVELERRIFKIREILAPIMPMGFGEALAIAQAQSIGNYTAFLEAAYDRIGPILRDALAEYER